MNQDNHVLIWFITIYLLQPYFRAETHSSERFLSYFTLPKRLRKSQERFFEHPLWETALVLLLCILKSNWFLLSLFSFSQGGHSKGDWEKLLHHFSYLKLTNNAICSQESGWKKQEIVTRVIKYWVVEGNLEDNKWKQITR